MDAEAFLVARLLAGDGRALIEIAARYGALVFGLARRVSASNAIAEDVVQEVLVDLWKQPDRFDPERGSLRAFLAMQAERRAVDAVRSLTRRAERERRHFVLESAVSVIDAEPVADVERAELAAHVRKAVNQLPPEQRIIVERAYYLGRTHQEIARELDLPEGTVKSRIRLAYKKLKPLLDPKLLQSAQ